jgi:hypothetical protein
MEPTAYPLLRFVELVVSFGEDLEWQECWSVPFDRKKIEGCGDSGEPLDRLLPLGDPSLPVQRIAALEQE